MLKFKPDIPLSRDDANRIMPWIIGFMVYLSCLTLMFAFNVNKYMSGRTKSNDTTIIVQVSGTKSSVAAAVPRVIEYLDKIKTFENVSVLSQNQVEELIKPWLGSKVNESGIELPTIIEAGVAKGETVDVKALQESIAEPSVVISISDNVEWMDKLSKFTNSVTIVSYTLVALVFAVTISIIVLACRTSVKMHADSIEILNMIGATRKYIANQFQSNQLRLALKGCWIGVTMLLLTIIPLRILASRINLVSESSNGLMASEILSVPVVIILTAGIAYFFTRYIVIGILKRA